MKFIWQKYVFSVFLLIGIIIGFIIGNFPIAIAISSLVGLVAHFVIGYFFPWGEK